MPAGHNVGFVHSPLPLTFSPSRIIKQNELGGDILILFCIFEKVKMSLAKIYLVVSFLIVNK